MGSGIGGNDPLLVVAIVPVPEDDESAVVDALVAVKGVQVQSGVVHHPDRSEPVAQVPALRPQDRLVHRVRVVRRHLDLQFIQYTCQHHRRRINESMSACVTG